MADYLQRNSPYVAQQPSGIRQVPANYNTALSPLEEMAFRQWLARNNVPFNPDAPVTDYDMRGFYRALQHGDPRATTAMNPNDQLTHYPDTWKTPLHQSFSAGSQWAKPIAPQWTDDDKLVSPSGRILVDERAPQPASPITRLGTMGAD